MHTNAAPNPSSAVIRPSLASAATPIMKSMEAFEASGSRENTGTGSRREGESFEHLVRELWSAFSSAAQQEGATAVAVKGAGADAYTQLSVGSRVLYVPAALTGQEVTASANTLKWLAVTFKVSNLLEAFPGEEEVIARYAPETGPYARERYPEIYKNMRTHFDDSLLLVESGVLKEKILLEYKTAKSTRGISIDGNAHERLSFQIMQYLEVATGYPRCSLAVITNGAFIRYRNKYHANFQVQADRLSNFCWFKMDYLCSAPEYARFLSGLLTWLVDGTDSREGAGL